MISADRSIRRCELAAVLLAFMHILTVSGMAYQGSLRGGVDELAINYGLWLSPIAPILLFRRIFLVVGICIIPISIDFMARAYYAWQFYWYGVNSIGQKGDWAFWTTTFLGLFSLAVVAVWLLVVGGKLIVNLISRLRRA
jgi:hypothetical protein